MTAAALEHKIRAAIPLSEAMQFCIERLSLDEIVVSAPLSPNINIHGTGFAGSIYAVAVLTGWALCTHILEQLEFATELVVAKADIRYREPVTTAIECVTRITAGQRETFLKNLRERGKGRILLEVEVGGQLATLHASFVAISRSA